VDHRRNPAVTSAEAVTLSSFSAVDASDGAALVAALDEQANLPAIERLRATVVELLALRPGSRLLDAGCGTGDVARRLAAEVGPTGHVIGVDASTTMVHEARRRTADATLPVEFHRGDITRLAAGDEAFDAAYSERVFQHLHHPRAAIAELVRVTRPGGRIAVIDSDWGMHAIHGADPALTARIIGCWTEHAVNGWAGRQLPALFTVAGLADQVVVADTITSRDHRPPTLQPFATMAAVADHNGAVTTHQAATWLAQLTDAGAHGAFFWAVTLIGVVATRPPPP
jgi:2-polyprenyl-3-methyl-5-hydroxy-6-metoxy-1,4-benzoquinol methylase